MALVQAASIINDPLSAAGTVAWVDGPLAAFESDSLIGRADLNTAEAKHAGAVLLAHLRAIKAATGANHSLVEAGHD